MNKSFCIIIFTFICIASGKQDRFNKNIFRSPVDFPLSLSGSFGDYRTNHFHSGIDIRTQGVTGKKVYASAEGWISRIRISPYGYGLALYIDHPQGYTTLYGHLKSFNKKIADYIKKKQYEMQQNEIDYYLGEGEIKINQGDVIALSGNSGSSSGPHIHFEIRDSKNQHPLNPLYFGFNVPDNLSPEVYNIRLYPLEPWSSINGKNEPQNFSLVKNKSSYTVNDKILVSGKIGVGIYSLDRFTNGKYKHCFNALSMKVNGIETFSFKYEELDFETLRDVNSHMDYEMKLNHKHKVTKCYKEPFSRLDFYETLVNNGIIELQNDESADVEVELNDNFDNSARISFSLAGEASEIQSIPELSFTKILDASKENVYRDEDLGLFFPEGRLYKDVYMSIEKKYSDEYVSAKYSIEPFYTPLKDWYTLKIKCDSSQTLYSEKLAIGSIDKDGEIDLYPSQIKNGWVIAPVKEFGEFAVLEDIESPKISFENFNSKTGKLKLRVIDNFEQIAKYIALVNGNWMRLYYDRKRDLLTANIFELEKNDSNFNLEVQVMDEQKNVGTFSKKIEIKE